jgi:hypothetical protein
LAYATRSIHRSRCHGRVAVAVCPSQLTCTRRSLTRRRGTCPAAISDVPEGAGPMEFVRRSHLVQLPHTETYNEASLLSRGQEIEWCAATP